MGRALRFGAYTRGMMSNFLTVICALRGSFNGCAQGMKSKAGSSNTNAASLPRLFYRVGVGN
jgi:hypothetical protein